MEKVSNFWGTFQLLLIVYEGEGGLVLSIIIINHTIYIIILFLIKITKIIFNYFFLYWSKYQNINS